MQVAVKKRILFNLLKNKLNENRGMGGDMGGRAIHPFNVQSPNSDPFGIYDDDAPIKPSSHMASQLSIEEPPVDDPEYVPNTPAELCAAATVICREVPLTQLEYFYRKLHVILDQALDREEEQNLDMMNESFDITRSTTFRDYNLMVEADRIRVRKREAEKPPGYAEAENQEAFMNGYEAGMSDPNPSQENAENQSMGSQDFINGYLQAMSEDEMGDENLNLFDSDEEEYDLPFPHDDEIGGRKTIQYKSFQQYLTRSAIEEIMQQPFESLDPFEQAVFNLHDELQMLFKKIDMEFTNEILNPDLEKEIMAFMKPLTNQYGITHNEILTPLNVQRMFATVARTKNAAKKEEMMNNLLMVVFTRISSIVEEMLKTDRRTMQMINNLAQQAGVPVQQFILKLKEAITQDYATYGTASRFDTDDELIKQKLESTFSIMIKTLKVAEDGESKFKNRKHFINNVNLNAEQEIADIFLDVLNKFKKGDNYELVDKDKTVTVSAQDFEEEARAFVAMIFDMAEDAQSSPVIDDEEEELTPEEEEIPAGLTEEEAFQKKVEMYAKRLSAGKPIDWIDLAPYFGFSNVSGIRQWFLKKVEPKIRIFSFRPDPDNPQQRSNINDMFDFNMTLLSQKMVEAINQELIPSLEKKVKKGSAKPLSIDKKKNKIKQIDEAQYLQVLKNQIVPMLEAMNEYFTQGVTYEELAEGSEFMQTIAGKVLRNVGGYTLDSIVDSLSSSWNEAIKQVINPIIQKHNPGATALNSDQLDSIVEYFTGLKNKPDFENKTKAANNLLAAGITPESYIEIAVEAANAWEDLADQFEDYDGAQFAEQMENDTDNLLKNLKELGKRIDSAFKEFMQEEMDSMRARQVGL